ncbi:MAG TPA: 50S ribosomal protein L15 [bacterium]|jgi:large subunit ribosomal protein L15|nr:50S ribosomal protein L15 [bacterium]MDX9805542.1 50S ribosomal protein L15 [bacterium]HNW16239.1 50S ribosomal protein L15 [bacterium]HNZ54451.1 50S ribosomal protein L15 [bacterium]HOB70526.1 50S ribosomal protein L15 [bacterium]
MQLYELKKPEGLKSRKRIGRGDGSGTGSTAGKGHKGQKARSGGGVRRGFEGGTMPYNRRIPKRGFFNKWATDVCEINIRYLEKFESGSVVDLEKLKEAGLYNGKDEVVKIIGRFDLTKAITVRVHKFTAGAKESIEKSGGKAEEISLDK